MKFHHSGIVCQKLEEEIDFFLSLGFVQESEIFQDDHLLVRGVFLINETRIELLEPLENSKVSKINKGKIFQQAFEIENLEKTINKFSSKQGWILLGKFPSVVFGEIALFYANGMVIEFIERKKSI